ncbi:histidine kinase dimerization/phospho-acceptor domain-containing protein, partial [Rhodoferax saidenbachensis]
MFLKKLYVRIWLAVVLAVAVLTLLVGWAWRMAADPPLREVVVRNAVGEIIGSGQARRSRPPPPPELRTEKRDATATPNAAGTTPDEDDADESDRKSRFGSGPEFVVRMQDGQTMHLHMPRPPKNTWAAPFGFLWTLGLVAIAVALATYPIVRRLTRRLEALQHSVQQWGDGNLSVRMPQEGDDEVGYLATRFNHAAQQIETLVKAQDALLASQKSLLANASHELRSPLTRIRMGLELMGTAPSLADQEEIARNIGELDQLIEEILLASRLDAREADLGTVEPVDLVGLAAEECARTGAQLEVAQTTLLVPGVSKLLRRVVRNLLENAQRYGKGEVQVVLRQEGAHAVLQVNDAGPGVPEALQTRIFE